MIGTQFLWQLYKSMHLSAGLGMYGRVLGDSGFANFSFSLLAVYVADFLLASGLVLAVPLFLWFRNRGRERFPLAVLLASTMAFQISIHGVLEAGLTGGLMERLFLYSFPLMAMFAVKGAQDLRVFVPLDEDLVRRGSPGSVDAGRLQPQLQSGC